MSTKNLISQIEDLSHDGRGIARVHGKTCFIKGALPGEQVAWRVTHSKSKFDEGVMTELISPAPERIEARCKHYRNCGGCALQHLGETGQIEHKQRLLVKNLQRAGLAAEQLLPAIAGTAFAYRRRARLAVQRARDGQYLVGFRNAGSKRIEPIGECPILEAQLEKLLPLLPGWIGQWPPSANISGIELVAGDNQLALAVDGEQLPNDEKLAGILSARCVQDWQIWWRGRKDKACQQIGGDVAALSYTLPENNQLHFQPGQFIQVNQQVNRLMVEQVLRMANGGELAVDLFCGMGNFSLPLAAKYAQVTGVEGLQELVDHAASNATNNGVNNTQFLMADLNSDSMLKYKIKQQPDLVLLDPPRAGAAGVMDWVASSGAKQIIYVSCHPATMARDAEKLTAAGYKLKQLAAMDMFPQTTHLEALGLFEK